MGRQSIETLLAQMYNNEVEEFLGADQGMNGDNETRVQRVV